MAQRKEVVTIGYLLDERGETEQDEEILERIKVLAQEHLPENWTEWEVSSASKEEVFGDKIDSNVLNKIVFALPTVGIARAFNPDADHLSEKGYREIRLKLLDWAFARALILGPPAIANRIRGSAARTEFFKQSIEPLRPLIHTRAEADKILSGALSGSEETSRKRRSASTTSDGVKRRKISQTPSTSQDQRIEALERRMEDMFSLLLEKLESRPVSEPESDGHDAVECSEESTYSNDDDSWKAPTLDPLREVSQQDTAADLEFLPNVKEADPLVPEPKEDIKREGIECQRFNSDAWNRIRYKEVAKHLQASPVFSALKVNVELGSLHHQPSPWLARQEGVLGTITHGLLLQRKALAEGLNTIVKKCPAAAEDLRQLISQESDFKLVSDNLLQFACAHRAEAIEMRRKCFKARNDVLNTTLHSINPSPTHLFDEKELRHFVKDNGGLSQVFYNKGSDRSEKSKDSFRKPVQPSSTAKGKQPTWRTRSTLPSRSIQSNRSYANRPAGGSKSSGGPKSRGKDRKKGRKY